MSDQYKIRLRLTENNTYVGEVQKNTSLRWIAITAECLYPSVVKDRIKEWKEVKKRQAENKKNARVIEQETFYV